MKSIKLLFCSLFILCLAGKAQVKPVEKAVIRTPTVLCDVCKERVEFFMGKEYGVSSVVVNTRKKTTTIVYLTDRTNLPTLQVLIAGLGFDADDIEADEYSFKRLPKACQQHKLPAKPAVPTKE